MVEPTRRRQPAEKLRVGGQQLCGDVVYYYSLKYTEKFDKKKKKNNDEEEESRTDKKNSLSCTQEQTDW